MLVVDGHTHIFPPELIRRRRQLAAADHWFGHLYECSDAVLATEEDLIASMDAAGIQHSVACGFPWSDPGLCREHNAWLAEVSNVHRARISFLAAVVPQAESASKDTESAINDGAVGIGELNADSQGFDLEEPGHLRPFMDTCQHFDKPVMIHASEPVGHTYPGKGTASPDKLLKWITKYQNQSLVLAHWGGGLLFYELMPEIADITNKVYYDSAASTYLYQQRIFSIAVSLVGAERIIFGTDYPVLGQRRLLNRTNKSLGQTDSLGQILGKTAQEVYGLSLSQS